MCCNRQARPPGASCTGPRIDCGRKLNGLPIFCDVSTASRQSVWKKASECSWSGQRDAQDAAQFHNREAVAQIMPVLEALPDFLAAQAKRLSICRRADLLQIPGNGF